jgi:hypothetical protein
MERLVNWSPASDAARASFGAFGSESRVAPGGCRVKRRMATASSLPPVGYFSNVGADSMDFALRTDITGTSVGHLVADRRMACESVGSSVGSR